MNKTTSSKKDPAIEVKQTQAIERSAPGQALSPWEEMDRVIHRMAQLFDSLLPGRWSRPRFEGPLGGDWMEPFKDGLPRVDVIDRDAEIVVKAELPGVTKENLAVSLAGNRLTIQGSTQHEENVEKGDYHRAETSRGTFTRTLTLPAEVVAEHANATFKDGLLELTLPKVVAAKRHTVEIQ